MRLAFFVLLLITNNLSAQQMTETLFYGTYEKPASLLKLEELINNNQINTNKIGFLLGTTEPYSTEPQDIIPFARTGGDGCYFAFLTDFGRIKDLELAPIVFISPTDFFQNETNGCFLFAMNFLDFLSIMNTILLADIIRFENLETMDFDTIINQLKFEHQHYDSAKENQIRENTINQLKEKFNLTEMGNLNAYYKAFYAERRSDHYIETKDGIGIVVEDIPSLTTQIIEEELDPLALEARLQKMSVDDRKKFYRDAPHLYITYQENYWAIKEVLVKQLNKDYLSREAGVLSFEVNRHRLFQQKQELDKKMLKKN